MPKYKGLQQSGCLSPPKVMLQHIPKIVCLWYLEVVPLEGNEVVRDEPL
jgi:hypothetical protein